MVDNQKREDSKAAEAAGFEQGNLPLLKELTAKQKTLLTELAARPDINVTIHAVPQSPYWRRRYLGLEKPGAIEKETNGIPLWKEIESTHGEDEDYLLDRNMSLADRLEVWFDIQSGAYRLDGRNGSIAWGKLKDITGQKDVAAIAAAALDRLAAKLVIVHVPFRNWSYPLFMAIHAAKVAIKPEWERFLPDCVGWKTEFDLYKNLIRSLPEERRLAAIMGSLGDFPSSKVSNGLVLLETFKYPEIAQYIEEIAPASGYNLARFRKAMKALNIPLKKLGASAPKLTIADVRKPKAEKDLSSAEAKQLAAFSKTYDGEKRTVRERMAEWAGELEIRDITDSEGKPAYTMILVEGDSGAIYVVGTTKEVAGITQSTLECDDPILRESLQEVTGSVKKKKVAPKKKDVATKQKAPKKK